MGNNPSAPQKIPTLHGTIEYQPYVDERGIQTAADRYCQLVEGEKMMSNGVRNLDILQPIRTLEVAEVNNPSIWTRVPPRPVYIWQERLGLCLVMFERVFETGRGFALQRNTRFLAVRKVAPVDPALVEVTEDIYEVAARKAIENIERAVFLFRPDEDLVRMIQADGTTYDETWAEFRLSKDWRDVRALSMLATDFPVIWNYVSNKPGTKQDGLFFPDSNRAPERAQTLDESRAALDNLSNVERAPSNDERALEQARQLDQALSSSAACKSAATPFKTVQTESGTTLRVNDAMHHMQTQLLQHPSTKQEQLLYKENRRVASASPGIYNQTTAVPPNVFEHDEHDEQSVVRADRLSARGPQLADGIEQANAAVARSTSPTPNAKRDYYYKQHGLQPLLDGGGGEPSDLQWRQFNDVQNRIAQWMRNQADVRR